MDDAQPATPAIDARVQLPVDAGHKRRPARLQDRVLPGQEHLGERFQPLAHGKRWAPPAGAQTSTSSTPETERRRPATALASSAAQMATTCGPASMVGQAGTPETRSSRSACRQATVAGSQYTRG